MSKGAWTSHGQGTSTTDGLEMLGLPRSQARIIRYFALRPDAATHGRHLQRVLGIGTASMQRDLKRLVALGALTCREDGRLVRYKPVSDSPLWSAFRAIIAATGDPSAVLRDALCDVAGIDAAFVFGSTAAGTRREDSDIDVIVVEGPHLDTRSLFSRLAEVGLLFATEVNAIRYTPQTLAERLGNPDHPAARFIRNLLEGPKQWVAGDPDVLAPLATAAGVRLDVPALLAS
jgi:predicted nucleotidyltransferase